MSLNILSIFLTLADLELFLLLLLLMDSLLALVFKRFLSTDSDERVFLRLEDFDFTDFLLLVFLLPTPPLDFLPSDPIDMLGTPRFFDFEVDIPPLDAFDAFDSFDLAVSFALSLVGKLVMVW